MLAPKPCAMAAPSFTCRCTPEYDTSVLLVAMTVMRFFLLDANNDALLRCQIGVRCEHRRVSI